MKNKANVLGFAILAGIIVAIVAAYFNLGNPIIHFESGCASLFRADDNKIDFTIRNRGDTKAISEVCFDSKDVIFNETNSSSFCYAKENFDQISSGLGRPYSIIFTPLNESNNISINIKANCINLVWGFIPKPCEGFEKECYYKNSGTYYHLVE